MSIGPGRRSGCSSRRPARPSSAPGLARSSNQRRVRHFTEGWRTRSNEPRLHAMAAAERHGIRRVGTELEVADAWAIEPRPGPSSRTVAGLTSSLTALFTADDRRQQADAAAGASPLQGAWRHALGALAQKSAAQAPGNLGHLRRSSFTGNINKAPAQPRVRRLLTVRLMARRPGCGDFGQQRGSWSAAATRRRADSRRKAGFGTRDDLAYPIHSAAPHADSPDDQRGCRRRLKPGRPRSRFGLDSGVGGADTRDAVPSVAETGCGDDRREIRRSGPAARLRRRTRRPPGRCELAARSARGT